ncbi:cyclase [Methanoculleus taiwanensis]|uniref:Cyclase n=1 Tax=Methanoculleus taiwanensis TaxID=1550565 RepID=A0A498H3P7_9EURY|nr:cyclase family protein [Methanoculleus taiwanensis]RXE57107.1 cyclase [Methanoculleus taiwanensis]
MQIFDVTRPISPDMLAIPGVTRTEFRREERERYLIADVLVSTHAGTHIDAPIHYLKTGMTVDRLPLDHLIGPCRVVDLGDIEGEIPADRLAGKIGGVRRLLLKTSFSAAERFDPVFPHLGLEAARLLVREGILSVGIDSPSIEALVCDGSVHRALLGNSCFIIEMLDLSGVPEGDYDLIALPLPLEGLDGSPARVVLCRKEE